jgi:hypothetical protein
MHTESPLPGTHHTYRETPMKASTVPFLLASMMTLSMCTTAFGQTPPATPVIETNGSRIGLMEILHQSGPDWSDYARSDLGYDALGNNISLRYSTKNFEGAWADVYSIEYTHDSAGRIVAYEFRYASGLIHDGQDVRYSYAYDDQGRLLESRHFLPEGEGWAIKGRTLHTYDTEGRGLHQNWQQAGPDETWRTWKEVEFTYDDVAGTTTEVLRHTNESNEMVIVSRIVTTRDGNERSALNQSYRGDDQWENNTLRTSTVNDSEKETAWTNAYWLNGDWSFNYRFRTLPSDVPTMSVTMNESFAGTEWIPTLRTTTTIGQYGVPEIVAEESFEAGEWRNRTRFVYNYAALTPVNAEPDGSIADGFTLLGNYPNPFNPSTAVRYEMQGTGHVSISVFDVMGRQVAILVDRQMPAGSHEAIFDAGHLPSGLYISRMNVGGRTSSRPMMLVK